MENNRVVAHTESGYKDVQFEWNINNSSFLISSLKSFVPFYSPNFEVELDSGSSTWKTLIVITPSHVREGVLYPEHIVALIELEDTKNPQISVNIEFILFNSEGKLIMSSIRRNHAIAVKVPLEVLAIEMKALLNEISHDDKLKLICNLKVCNQNFTTKLASRSPLCNFKSSIINDFAKLRMDRKFSDFTISVHGKEYHAHKNILAARSPVFSTMFENKMKETNCGKVEIEDMEAEVMEEFLNFIYTGKANIKKNVYELLAAADKYDVQDLKAACEDALLKDLSKENCFKTLILSDLHSATNLKKEAMNFIASNDLVDKNNLALIEDLSLAKELIEAFANHTKTLVSSKK